MQSKIKICKTGFFANWENVKSKIAQNPSYRFFTNFGSKRDSPQQINCENFIIGCPVGFRAILDQRKVSTTLDENWIAHVLYLSARSCDAMFRVRESESKLELFYRVFIKLFLPYFFALGLNTCLNRVWNYLYIYQRDLTPFKCLRLFLSIALRIPTAHDFCVISARKLARARTQRKKFPSS